MTRTVVAVTGGAVGLLPFLALFLLVGTESEPLQQFDDGVVGSVNDAVQPRSWLVSALKVATDLGGSVEATYVLALTAAFLALRRQWRLVLYVATTGLALAALVPVTKALAGRPRPVLELPVAELPSNASFPSGHAMVATVTWLVVAIVLLPAVRARWRGWLIGLAVAIAVLVGLTRVALGVHFLSDVVAGWALGAALVVVSTTAFRAWEPDDNRARGQQVLLAADDPRALRLPSAQPPALGYDRGALARLAAWAAVVVGLLSALGLLVTGPLRDVVGQFDRRVTQAAVELRDPGLTAVVHAVDHLADTRYVIAIAVAAGVLALASTHSWRPGWFLAVTLVGETLLYFVTAQVVSRARPDVRDLTSTLPAQASWPSGHVAAAVALYGALALVVIAYSRWSWRWVVLAVPLVVPVAIAAGRVYLAAHYPSDVLAGLLLGTVWVVACARVLLQPYRDLTAGRADVVSNREQRERAA